MMCSVVARGARGRLEMRDAVQMYIPSEEDIIAAARLEEVERKPGKSSSLAHEADLANPYRRHCLPLGNTPRSALPVTPRERTRSI